MTRALCVATVILTAVLSAGVAEAVPLRGLVSIDITADGQYAVIVCRKDNSVAIVDLTANPFTFVNVTQAEGIGEHPIKVRVFGSTAVIVNEHDETLTLVDVPSATVTGSVSVPMYSQDVVWDDTRSQFSVSNRWKDRVYVFDASWHPVAPATGIDVGRMPGPMTLGPDGRLYIGNSGSWDVSVVDPDLGVEVARVTIGSRPEDLAATGNAVLVTNHGGGGLQLFNGMPLIDNDQADIRNVVTEIDPVTLDVTERWEDRGADYADIDVAHGMILFSGAAGGTVHVHRLGDPLKLLLTRDLLQGDALPGGHVGGNPNGNRIFTNTRDTVARLPDQVFAINFLRDTMVELWIVGNELVIQGELPLNPAGVPIQAFQAAPAVNMEPFQHGERYFNTLSAWSRGQEDFSCSTCHPDGHSDFRLLFDTKPDPFNPDLVQGVERHPTTRFTSSTGPFAWEGDKRNLLEMTVAAIDTHDTPPSGFVALDTAEFMEQWQVTLASGPNPNPPWNPAGRTLFEGVAGCAGCHPAPLYTDNSEHDVGTGRTLNTPSLLGVWDQVNLLHDGRAQTPADLLDPALYSGPTTHGNLAVLSEPEKAQLTEYVLGLRGPGEQTCAGDITGSGTVDVTDLVEVILEWGACPASPATCPADTNGDGVVDVLDLLAVILDWGVCS